MSTLSRVIFDLDTTPPSIPSNVIGAPISSSRIDLSWAASVDTGGSGLAGYVVFRNGVQIGTASTTAYSDTGLAASTAYLYRIAAVDGAGNVSAQATAISVTTLPGAGTPALFLNFDSLTVGSSSGLGTVGGAIPTVDNAQSFSGANSAKTTIASGAFFAGGYRTVTVQCTQGDEVWFRFRTFFPTGFNFQAPGNGHLKFMRIDTGPTSGASHSHLDWYLAAGSGTAAGFWDFILEGSAQSWLFGGTPTTPVPTGIVRNVWQTWEGYYKLHTVAASAIIRLWRDGVRIVDTSANIPSGVAARSTLNNATDVAGFDAGGNGGGFMMSTYWNGGSPANQSWWIDDFTIYTSKTGAPANVDSSGNPFIGMT